MTPRTPALFALPAVALAVGLALCPPPAAARPLLRLHVRPSAYRVAPPRLPSVRLPHADLSRAVQQAAGQAAGLAPLAPQAAAPAAAAAAARALLGRH